MTELKIPQLTAKEVNRFWRKVKMQPNGCWEWQGAKKKSGYGLAYFQGNTFRTPRIAYKLYYLKDPFPLFVLHSCDNPKCVNPFHLWLGTRGENNTDRHKKGRTRLAIGAERSNARLNENEVLEIRKRYSSGEGVCKLGRLFGVSYQTICSIVQRKKWKHI